MHLELFKKLGLTVNGHYTNYKKAHDHNMTILLGVQGMCKKANVKKIGGYIIY